MGEHFRRGEAHINLAGDLSHHGYRHRQLRSQASTCSLASTN